MTIKKTIMLLFILIVLSVCTITITANIATTSRQQSPQFTSLQTENVFNNREITSFQQLLISKDDGMGHYGFVYPGDPYQYTISISNPTSSTVYNVSVVDRLTTKVTFVAASHGGLYIPTLHQVFWNFSSLSVGQTTTLSLLVAANPSISGCIIYNNVTIYGTGVMPTNATETTLVWEGNPPVTTIEIGTPYYAPGPWITSQTPLWLNATDDFAGVKEIHYVIQGNHFIAQGNATIVFIPTEGQYNLMFWAVDYFNNTESSQAITVFVENTPPDISIETGQPSYGQYLGRNTPIWINTTDQGFLGGVGINNLTYEMYKKIGSTWIYQYRRIIVDNDINDTNPLIGTISVKIHFNESGQHQIRYWATDKLTNRQPSTGSLQATFYVDAEGPQVTVSFSQPKNDYFRYHNGQWYTGIGKNTPVILQAVDKGPNGGVGAQYLFYEVFTAETYGEWVYQYTVVVQDNIWPDMNPLPGVITTMLFMDESCWHQLHYWAYDKLENRHPVHPWSYEQIEFLVDAENPVTSSSYTQPQYLDPVNNHMWITNKTKKQLVVTDTGCNPQGSGVYQVLWFVTKKIGGQWVEIQQGVVFDNDRNDTDGIPAVPWLNHLGGVWAMDNENRAFIFQDLNRNGSYDSAEPLLHLDPDGDGLFAVPRVGDSGGLYALDRFQEPFVFHDSNQNYIYDDPDEILYLNPNANPPPAQPVLGTFGGLYAFDNQSRPYTFRDLNNNWKYDLGEPLISLKPNGLNVGSIHMSINISDDGEYHIYHQATDTLGNIGLQHKEYVKVDNTPPSTTAIVGTPSYYYYDAVEQQYVYCVTPKTPITLQTVDNTAPCAVGIRFFYYEIHLNNSKIYEKNVTLFNEDTFTFPAEGIYTLSWYAVDKLGNREQTKTQTFRVDDTPPQIHLIRGEPLIPASSYSWVNKTTAFTIDATNPGYCPFYTVRYRLNRGTWHTITHQLPYTFRFTSECIYELDIIAFDVLNHVNRVIELYYVDDTPPQYTIIKPVDGWYTTGSPIPAIIAAVDEPNHATPCHDELAVGISPGRPVGAFLLDAFPSFQYIYLNGSNCVYVPSQQKFIGNLIVPQEIPFENGPVLFGVLLSDDLGNINNTLDILHQLFLQAYGDETLFNQLIQPLLNTNQIRYIGIDTIAPTVTITQPIPGTMIGPNPVTLTAVMQDTLSGITPGTPCHVSLQGILLGILPYDTGMGGCSGMLPIPQSIPSGQEIPLTVSVTDSAGNIGQTTILVDVTTTPMNTPPVGFIRHPLQGGTYQNILSIQVEAYDAETPTQDLQVLVEITRTNDPTFMYEATYQPLIDMFIVDINISTYTNGAMLQVKAYVTDGDGNTIVTLPVHCYVASDILFDQWMAVNWNMINLPNVGSNTTIEHVFQSILGDFDYIFDSITWDNYKYGRPVNTLTNAQAGVWYWVNMVNATRYYLKVTG